MQEITGKLPGNSKKSQEIGKIDIHKKENMLDMTLITLNFIKHGSLQVFFSPNILHQHFVAYLLPQCSGLSLFLATKKGSHKTSSQHNSGYIKLKLYPLIIITELLKTFNYPYKLIITSTFGDHIIKPLHCE